MQFLSMDWELFEDYRDLKAFVCGLEVVNDSAERGVKMICDFKDIVDNEEQQQYLLQVIEKHRQEINLNGRKQDLGKI
jgi:hypothetical protein